MISLDLKPDRPASGGTYPAADCYLCGSDAASDCRAVLFRTLPDNLTTLKTIQSWEMVRVKWRQIFPPSTKLVVAVVQAKTYEPLAFICYDCMEKHVQEFNKIYGREDVTSATESNQGSQTAATGV